MTRHPFDPSCDCDSCFAAELERVASAFRDIRGGKSPLATLPGWEAAQAAVTREMALGDDFYAPIGRPDYVMFPSKTARDE